MIQQFADAQAAFPFVQAQGVNIETAVYQTRYPNYDYANVLPVVTQGAPWAVGTQFNTMDLTGEAKFLSGSGTDMPFSNAVHAMGMTGFALLGSGWEWTLEEVNQAALYGIALSDAKARAATQSVERKLYDVAMAGSTEKNWTGFVNATGVAVFTAAATGTGSSTFWANKTPAQILADLNAAITTISRNTNEVEYADTIALPPAAFDYLATTYVGTEGNSQTILDRFRTSNPYTSANNGAVLEVKRVRALANAGAGGTGRLVAYRNSDEVLRFHLPMPRQMLPIRSKSIMAFEAGIIARTGGTEVRLPGAMVYEDAITPAP